MTLVEFICRDLKFAVPLKSVRRVLPAALPVPVPGTPPLVLGMLEVEGEMLPVIDFAVRCGFAPTSLQTSHQLLVLDLDGLALALLVDAVPGTRESVEPLAPVSPVHGDDLVAGMMVMEDGMRLLCDPERLLLDENRRLLLHPLEELGHAG